MTEERQHVDRVGDKGFWCAVARRFADAWDFIDNRDVDKHFVTVFILYGTYIVTNWSMRFAEHGDRPGLEIAAIIGAVAAPYMALQAAAIAWYFKSRTE